jgi:glutathione S-transferase
MTEDIVLYHSPASRSFTAYWMLEEIGRPYRIEIVDIRTGAQKSPEYLRVNPSGKVPAVRVGDVVVTERPAICIYLADRFAYGRLTPEIDAPARAEYLKWMIYSVSVVEPVASLRQQGVETSAFHSGWGGYDDMVEVLAAALDGRDHLLGASFTAADIMLGGNIGFLLFNKMLPERDVFADYWSRISARPAYQEAAAATWPRT